MATPPYNDLDEVANVVKDKIGTWALKKPFVFEVPNAELIGITDYSAGLTNIIFSRNLTVIEIFGSLVIPCYFSLTKALGFQYGCLGFTSPDLNFDRTIRHGDIIIDVAKLLIFIAKMQKIRLVNRVE